MRNGTPYDLRNHHRRNRRPRHQGRYAAHHQPPAGAERFELAGSGRADRGLRRLSGRWVAAVRGADRQRRQGFRGGCGHQGNEREAGGGLLPRRFLRPVDFGNRQEDTQAVDRRGQRLCAGRGLRAGDDGGFHHCVRQGQVWPARDQARGRSRHGRIAAADPRDRQVEVDGNVPDRPDDGRRRGRAQQSGGARGAA